MYLYARACIFVQGNPSHVRILVFGLSRCTHSATPTDMDSLLVMSRDGFYVRCFCAGCLYLTCRGEIVRLPVCTADREGGWHPGDLYYVYNTLHSCRAVAVPLHSVYRACTFYPFFFFFLVLVTCVYYCTVGPGNVRFTRFVLVPCCGCTIAPRFVLAPCNSQPG